MRPIPTEPMLERCPVCQRETRHEPDANGAYHCVACRERRMAAAQFTVASERAAQRKMIEARNRRTSRINTVVVVLALLLVAGGITWFLIELRSRGYFDYEEKPTRRSDPPAEVLAVTSDQLERDYSSNEVAADARYRGKVLRVTGAVQAIRKDILNDPYVVLWTKNEFRGAQCHFDSDNNAALARIAVGDHITVRCRGNNEILGSPQLKDCVLE